MTDAKIDSAADAMPLRASEDIDAAETQEWREALQSVIEADGPERAQYLLETMIDEARRAGSRIPFDATTAYVNTIPPHME